MKVILDVELVGYNNPPAGETYIELTKGFELDFAPFEGLRLQFPCIKSDHPDVKSYREVLTAAPELTTGVFKVETVYYHVDKQRFVLQANDAYETPEALHSVVEQLIVGYGFIQK